MTLCTVNEFKTELNFFKNRFLLNVGLPLEKFIASASELALPWKIHRTYRNRLNRTFAVLYFLSISLSLLFFIGKPYKVYVQYFWFDFHLLFFSFFVFVFSLKLHFYLFPIKNLNFARFVATHTIVNKVVPYPYIVLL